MTTLEAGQLKTDQLLDALKNDVGLAIQYHSLLLHFSDQRMVLNKSCPEIWSLVNRSLFDSLLSIICRICDTDGQGRKEKFTITRVASSLDLSGGLRDQVEKLIDQQEANLNNIKVIRNNSIGHANLKVRLGQVVLTYDPADIGHVLDMLKKATDLLFEFAKWGSGGWEYYEEFRIPGLMKTLEAGQREVGELD